MSFLRSSWRAVAGASGLGLLVPGGLLLALAVAATVSGVGGLGADLRQVFRGPDVPIASAGTATFDDGTGAGADGVPEIPEAPQVATGGAGAATGGEAQTDEPGTTDRGDRDDRDGTDDGRTTPTPPRPNIQTTPATPSTPSSPSPAPAPGPGGPVRQLGGLLTDTVRPLPLVGPPVADAVQSVIDLVEPPPGTAVPRQPLQP